MKRFKFKDLAFLLLLMFCVKPNGVHAERWSF